MKWPYMPRLIIQVGGNTFRSIRYANKYNKNTKYVLGKRTHILITTISKNFIGKEVD
jgi:hypothetical protein